MRELFYLSDKQIERIRPFFPHSHSIPTTDDVRVLSGIIFVIRYGLRWRDAPPNMVLTKLCIVVLSAGAILAYSITSFLNFQRQRATMGR